jgi:peptidoglycan/xylan/chitin deacetylase (PgdA/CDA1 family)
MPVRYCWLILLSVFGTLGSAYGQVTYSYGAIVRGDVSSPQIALVFTGDEHGDGTPHIARVLDSLNVKASFFFTGRFYRNPVFEASIQRLRADGHYLGAHSDQHLLYCSWEERDSTLVSREEFRSDVLGNYMEIKRFGIDMSDAPYFLPAYEWYNEQIGEWTDELGLQLVSYTPGTRSHADYTTADMGEYYVATETIVESILTFEAKESDGLNGFILLAHVGVSPERMDKFYLQLGPLVAELMNRGYAFVRIDELLTD